MKHVIIVLGLLVTLFVSQSQNSEVLDLDAHFTAIIVKDIEVSLERYTKVLGFETINKIESEEIDFKQSNLKRGSITLELNRGLIQKKQFRIITIEQDSMGFLKLVLV